MLKVSPWKGVIRFGKRGKLNPRYIGTFKIIAKVGTVAYLLELPEKLSRVHSMFQVSKLKKCMADEPLVIPLDEIQVDDKLNFIEEPVEIMGREVKRLKQSRIPIVKVRWNSRRGPEFTWEREDQMQKKYPHLFTNSAPAAEDVLKMKTEALKEQTSASRPIKSLMVYPPNAPTMLVPRNVNLHLIEVIPFFKTLKEHFEGIQKALTKEIKEMKDIFEELEAEVDQNVMNRNVFTYCKQIPSYYDLDSLKCMMPHIIVQARCLELEAKLSKLHDKVQKDDYTELVKLFPTLRYAIDVEPIPPHSRNNREVHLDYLKHLKESVETLHDIVEEAKFERPLDRSLASACLYTKHSQELLEYVISTCLKDFNKLDKKHASTPLTRKKQVTFEDQCEMSNNNTHKHVEQLNIQKTNVLVIPSTGVNSCTDASGSKPRSNTKKNRISPAKSVNKKKVEEHPRTNKSSLKNMNRVDSSISFKHTVINSNSHSICKTEKCNTPDGIIFANHDMCMVNYLHFVNASPYVKNVVRKVKKVWKPKQVKQVWKATGKVLTNVGYQ
ncbi:hypothetical protein Tco_0072637 [Tanacetum coccineum]